MTSKDNQKLAIILQHGSYEKLHLAATLAASTNAMGGEVHIFLSHEALLAYVYDKLDEAQPTFNSTELNKKYMEYLDAGKIASPSSLFKKAQELGVVKIYGCSESTQVFRLTSKYTNRLAAVIGYTTFLDIASNARLIVI